MIPFDIHKLREIADEGIARHGLRGYARKLDLDVSTVRSLRDGRDMQISKVTEIVNALGLTLGLRRDAAPVGAGSAEAANTPQLGVQPAPDAPGAADTPIAVGFHPKAAPPGPAYVAFQPSWLAAQRWSPDTLCCVYAPETTGTASVMPGALCLLNSAQGWPGAHAIWAYLEEDILRVSYLSRPDPGILLVSGRHPSIPPRQISGPALDSITPLGQVVWTGTLLPQAR